MVCAIYEQSILCNQFKRRKVMQKLTPEGQQTINNIAQRYGISTESVNTILNAVSNGGGTAAQFYCPELGGGGQWMQGGMTMVGDMFNYGLKSTVDNLCSELSTLLANQPIYTSNQPSSQPSVSLFVPEANGASYGNWWPADLGSPNSTGGQNNLRYAYFGDARRLAVDLNGDITLYDTLDHQIGGVSQQQGYGASFTFTSQYGVVSVENLPIITQNGMAPVTPDPIIEAPIVTPEFYQAPMVEQPSQMAQEFNASPTVSNDNGQENNVIDMIQNLAKLKDMGILTEDEFSSKKTELLSKI
jgi:hypothetical protein